MRLTRGELSLLETLIESDEPLSKTGILTEAPEDKGWKDSSIHILLNSLLDKGAIQEAGFVRTGKGYGRTFTPSKEGKEYVVCLLLNLAKKIDTADFLSRLIDENTLSKKELQQLASQIKEKTK